MTSSSEQPPKEYIITEDRVVHIAKIFAVHNVFRWEDVIDQIRSRPHPAPAFKRCCDSCINVPCKVLNRIPCLAQEKQENICEENGCTDIENCDEICQHSRLFSPLQMQEAKEQAAKAERERAQQRIDAAIEQLSDINKYAREEYEEANLSDNEREMRIHLEYGNRVWGVVRFLRAQPEPQQEGRR